MSIKETTVKIINLSTLCTTAGDKSVFGLGDDGKVYWWNWSEKRWELYAYDGQ